MTHDDQLSTRVHAIPTPKTLPNMRDEAVPGATPFAREAPSINDVQEVPSLGMSKTRRTLLLISAGFFQLTLSGVGTGYQALRPLLVQGGLYHELCDGGTPKDDVCIEQEQALASLLQFSAGAINIGAFFMGILLDAVGPKIASAIACACIGAGFVVFSLAKSIPIWASLVAYSSMGVFGGLFFLSIFHISLLFGGKGADIVTALLMSLFDASSGIFYILQMIHNGMTNHPGFQPLFLAYSAIPFSGVLLMLLVQPMKPAPQPQSNASGSINGIDTSSTGRVSTTDSVGGGRRSGGVIKRDLSVDFDRAASYEYEDSLGESLITNGQGAAGAGVGRRRLPATQNMKTIDWIRTPQFLVFLLFSAILLPGTYFYMGSVHLQVKWLTHGSIHDADQGAIVFSIMLCLLSPACFPLCAWVLNQGLRFSFAVTSVLVLLYSMLGIIHNLSVQYVTFAAYIVCRCLFFGSCTRYMQTMFPAESFGIALGTTFGVSGAISFASPTMYTLIDKSADGSYFVANIVIGVLGVIVGLPFSYMVGRWQ